MIDDRNPSTGLARGLFDQVREIAMVNRRAGTKPRKVYTAYRRATERRRPAVEETWYRMDAGILSVKQVQTIRTVINTAMNNVL